MILIGHNLVAVVVLSMVLSFVLIFPSSSEILYLHHNDSQISQTPTNGTIMLDYGHGQCSDTALEEDLALESVLEELGYTVIWQNESFINGDLDEVDGLIIGSILGESYVFTENELVVISNWFNSGKKFMWIAGDSDYAGYTYINDNMNAILEFVKSHVFLEPTDVYDEVLNCGQPYRPIANVTTRTDFLLEAVVNVDSVLLHGPTLLYGSTSSNSTAEAVPLESYTINNVYPLLMFSSSATIIDSDAVLPIAHSNNSVGSFVAVTIELQAGLNSESVLVVSGASPYGDFMPMFCSYYYSVNLTGDLFVSQTINLGMTLAEMGYSPPPTTATIDIVTPTTTTTTTSITTLDSAPFIIYLPLIISLISATTIVICFVLIARYRME